MCFLVTCLHAFLGGICILFQDMFVCFCGRYFHTLPRNVCVLLWEVFAYSSRTCLCDFWDMCFWGYMPVCFSWTDMFICFSGTPVCAFHGQICSSAFQGHLCMLFMDRHVHLLFWDTFVCFSRTDMLSAFLGHLCMLFTDRHVHLLFWDTFVCFSQTDMFICFSGTPLCVFLGIVMWGFLQTWWCVFLVHIYKRLLATVFSRCLDVKHHVYLWFSADAGGDGRHGFGVTAQGGQHRHHHRREGTSVGTAA